MNRGALRKCWLDFPVANPGSARSVAHVQDFNRLIDNPVENPVSISPDCFHAYGGVVASLRPFGILRDELYSRVDRSQDIAGAARTSFIDVPPDAFDIVARTRCISDPHRTPYFFQNASISSSGTNSPRAACCKPSCTAARSSLLIT